MGSNVFARCTSLTKDLTFPKLKSIGLVSLYMVGSKKMSFGALESIPSVYYGKVFGDPEILEEVDFTGSTFTEMNDYNQTFGNYTALKKIILPQSCTTLLAFKGCTKLENINLENVTSIGNRCFEGCASLSNIDIFNSKTIGDNAFYNCTSLEIEDLSLPNLETLGQNAFYGVKIKKISNLGKITAWPYSNGYINVFSVNAEYLESVTVPDGITDIPGGFLYDCINVRELHINWQNIKSIGWYAFRNCKSLVIDNLSIPNLETLGEYTFDGVKIKYVLDLGKVTTIPGGNWGNFLHCDKDYLEGVILPDTVTTIGYHLLRDCTNVKFLVVKSIAPPTLTEIGHFEGSPNCPIYVPDASVTAYQEATNWSSYASRIKAISDLPIDNPEVYEEIKEYLN